jgi:hypothetical protein
MNLKQMTEVIETAIEAMPHAKRLYPDLYAEDIANAVIAAQGDDSAEFHVRRDAPETSRAVAPRIREGSLQDDVLRLFINLAHTGVAIGATDDDIEVSLKRSHQSVSGARNTLVRKGYLVDSGERRPNRYGNMAIRWTYTGKPVER